MTLEELSRNKLIRPTPTSPREIQDLWQLVQRDLSSATIAGLPLDWQFAIAYHAVLQLATIVLRCEGYRAASASHHTVTFTALAAVAGQELGDLVEYFQACRAKRNIVEYDRAGEISQEEVAKLLAAAGQFRKWVAHWTKTKHPDLAPDV